MMYNSKIYSILVADDDSEEIELLIESFENQNQFKINFIAKNGLELVDYVAQHSTAIDIVISDMFMPAMNGIEAIEKLQADNLLDNVLTVVFSNTVNIENNDKFKATNNLKFYTKPASISEYNNLPSKLLTLLQTMQFNTF